MNNMQLVMRTVAELQVTDLLLLPETPLDNLQTVEVTTLRRATRSGRITIWVRSNHPSGTLHRAWRYGTFKPTDPIQRLEFS